MFLFENEKDARRVMDVLPKRLAKYGLALHPDKTRLVDFRRPDRFASPAAMRARGPGRSTCSASRTTGASRARELGRQAADREGPLPARDETGRGVVPAVPPRAVREQ